MKPKAYIIDRFFRLMTETSTYPLPLRDACRCYGGAMLFQKFQLQYPDVTPEEFFALFEEFSVDLQALADSSLSPDEQTAIVMNALMNDQPLTVPEDKTL